MTKRQKKRLTDVEKAFVVQELACFGSPKEVAETLMEECAVQLAPQNIERYDPNKRAGQNLAQKWRELFEHTRNAFLDHVEKAVPHAHKAVRIKKLARAADAFENGKNYYGMANMLERIAKEMGNVHTNRREFTGKDRGPIQVESVANMTDEQIDTELTRLWDKAHGVEPKSTKHWTPDSIGWRSSYMYVHTAPPNVTKVLNRHPTPHVRTGMYSSISRSDRPGWSEMSHSCQCLGDCGSGR